ncbi:5642_t:CDS:2 [Entrophospora sp. SA101]|nr:5642_t:CDS:2 [Entrophospora sp. SA101]
MDLLEYAKDLVARGNTSQQTNSQMAYLQNLSQQASPPAKAEVRETVRNRNNSKSPNLNTLYLIGGLVLFGIAVLVIGNIMTGINENNKYIPKTPETYEVRFVEQQNQQEQSEQKSTAGKAAESVANVPSTVKEAIVPSVHASDSKEDKGSSNDGRGSPKIVQADNKKELSEIFEKVNRARKERNLSLQESYDLYFEAKEKYLVAKEKERTEEAGEWMLLGLLKKGCDEVLEAFSGYLKPNLLAYRYKPYDIHHAEVKEKIRKIRGLIKQYEESSTRI